MLWFTKKLWEWTFCTLAIGAWVMCVFAALGWIMEIRDMANR